MDAERTENGEQVDRESGNQVIRKEGAIGEKSVKRMDDHWLLVIDIVDFVPRNEEERLTTGEMETADTLGRGDTVMGFWRR